MYKYKSGQISITDFGQPMGMHLNENNRWVKKAAMIPWNEIEKRYAGLFKSHKGACMIQAEYGYSDEEITLQIQESPYLQYFCGYEAYDDSKPPFDSSSMVYFRKRLTPVILGDINEMILSRNKTEDHTDDKDGNDDSNSGTMIVDATCAPSKIKYPQDGFILPEKTNRAPTEKEHIKIIWRLYVAANQPQRKSGMQ